MIFGKPIYDSLYVGNVHERSILKDKKDIERWKLNKSTPFLKSRPVLSLGKKLPILFGHCWENWGTTPAKHIKAFCLTAF